MRHKVYGKHLGRDKNERTALFKNLVGALILHGSIETTESKAKAIKGLVDKIIHQAKSKNTQRLVSMYLTQKNVQEKLFKEVVPGVGSRNSGFTSVVKLGKRLGDNAMTVRMSILMETEKLRITQKTSKSESLTSRKSDKQSHSESSEKTKSVTRKRVIKK